MQARNSESIVTTEVMHMRSECRDDVSSGPTLYPEDVEIYFLASFKFLPGASPDAERDNRSQHTYFAAAVEANEETRTYSMQL